MKEGLFIYLNLTFATRRKCSEYITNLGNFSPFSPLTGLLMEVFMEEKYLNLAKVVVLLLNLMVLIIEIITK